MNNYSNNNHNNQIFKRLNQIFIYAKSHPGKIKSGHIALYHWAIVKLNKLHWKDGPFGLPSGEAMKMLGIKQYRTYWKIRAELDNMGLIKIHTKGENQSRACQITLPILDNEDNNDEIPMEPSRPW